MSIRVAALWAVASILVCGGCAADWLVLRGGKVVARTEPAVTTVVWDGREEEVDFLR